MVQNFPIEDWQERESLLQSALKRWLFTVISFPADPQSTTNFSGMRRCKKLAVIADVFSGTAASTWLKKGRAVEGMIFHLGVGLFS